MITLSQLSGVALASLRVQLQEASSGRRNPKKSKIFLFFNANFEVHGLNVARHELKTTEIGPDESSAGDQA